MSLDEIAVTLNACAVNASCQCAIIARVVHDNPRTASPRVINTNAKILTLVEQVTTYAS